MGAYYGAGHDRRRTERVLAQLPVVVRGMTPDRQPFSEPTRAIVLNAHGGLITLAAGPRLGQKLLLTNPATEEEQECRVVYLGPEQAGRSEVGLAFKEPAPKFWGVATPPADWKPYLD